VQHVYPEGEPYPHIGREEYGGQYSGQSMSSSHRRMQGWYEETARPSGIQSSAVVDAAPRNSPALTVPQVDPTNNMLQGGESNSGGGWEADEEDAQYETYTHKTDREPDGGEGDGEAKSDGEEDDNGEEGDNDEVDDDDGEGGDHGPDQDPMVQGECNTISNVLNMNNQHFDQTRKRTVSPKRRRSSCGPGESELTRS